MNPRRLNGGITTYLILAFIIAVIPAVIAIWWSAQTVRQHEQTDAFSAAERLADTNALMLATLSDEARTLLPALGNTEAARRALQGDRAACDAQMAALLATSRRHLNLGVVDPQGRLVCSGLPQRAPVEVGNVSWFQRAVAAHGLLVGNYLVGSVSGRPGVVFSEAIIGSDGAVLGVAVAGVDLAWLSQLMAVAEPLPGTSLTVLDSAGLVLARHPQRPEIIGQPVWNQDLLRMAAAAPRNQGVFPGLGGAPRLFASRTLDDGAGGGVHLLVGVAEAAVSDPLGALFPAQLGVVVLVNGVVVTTVGVLFNWRVRRPLMRLALTAARVASGDYRVRYQPLPAVSEIEQLGFAIDDMAVAVRDRTAALEAAFREAEAQRALLRKCLDGLGDTVYVLMTTPDGTVVEANEQLLALRGHAREAVVGRNINQFPNWSKPPGNRLTEAITAAAEGRQSRHTAPVWRAGGDQVPLDITVRPVLGPGGGVEYITAAGVDISEQEAARARLTEALDRLITLVDLAPDPIIELAVEGPGRFRQVRVNQAFLEASHLDRAQVEGKLVEDLPNTQLPPAFLTNCEAVVNTRRTVRWQQEVTFPSGTRIGQIAAAPLLNAEGACISIIQVVRDVTDLVTAQRQVAESEERFRQVVENMTEVFWLSDPEKDTLFYVSPAFERVWGFPGDRVLAQPRAWVDAIDSDDRPRVVSAALTKQVTGEYDEIYRICRPDGEVRWVRDRAYPVRDEAGRVYRIAGVSADVTDAVAHEQALREFPARLLLAQEAERAGLARELHDGLQQVLLAAKLRLSSCESSGDAPRSQLFGVPEVITAIDHALAECRRIAAAMHPHLLNELGLVDALRYHLRQQVEATGSDLTLTATGSGRGLPPRRPLPCSASFRRRCATPRSIPECGRCR